MMKTMTAAGWYPDPAGISTHRYFDGRQWTTATAVLTAAPVLVAAPAAPRSFAARHPWLTTLGILWGLAMALHWWWLVPLLIAGFGLQRASWAVRRRAAARARENARTSAEADFENRLYLRGDARGTYGKYRPASLG
jgi:hypothetical protein